MFFIKLRIRTHPIFLKKSFLKNFAVYITKFLQFNKFDQINLNVCSPTTTRHMKKPKHVDQQDKYCLPFHPFKCVISKQYNPNEKINQCLTSINHCLTNIFKI